MFLCALIAVLLVHIPARTDGEKIEECSMFKDNTGVGEDGEEASNLDRISVRYFVPDANAQPPLSYRFDGITASEMPFNPTNDQCRWFWETIIKNLDGDESYFGNLLHLGHHPDDSSKPYNVLHINARWDPKLRLEGYNIDESEGFNLVDVFPYTIELPQGVTYEIHNTAYEGAQAFLIKNTEGCGNKLKFYSLKHDSSRGEIGHIEYKADNDVLDLCNTNEE